MTNKKNADAVRGRSIVHHATPEELERHREVRRQIDDELPELREWSRRAAAARTDQVAVGAVFTAAEKPVIEAMDAYAVSHSLPNRSAVVREALGRLLGMPIQLSGE